MSLTARGTAGELRKGYQVAARLGAWTLDHHGRCDATLLEVQTFWLEQPGSCALWLQMGKRFWVWRDVEVLSTDGTISVRVQGSPDVRE